MSCLCYCIGSHLGPQLPETLRGVGDRPVYRVAHGFLSAAVSTIAEAHPGPELTGLRAYERVVLSLNQQQTVIPLRYGCVVKQESQVIRLLEDQGPLYAALLKELDGCVEMGLRVLLPPGRWAAATSAGAPPRREVEKQQAPSGLERLGLAYLTARKAHYARQDRWTAEYRWAAERCQDRFAGLFLKCKTEPPSPRLPLLSLYFLVRRGAVSAFRQAFRSLAAGGAAKLLLSGPWPPYNFVSGGPNILDFASLVKG